MSKTRIDITPIKKLSSKLSDIEKRQIPYATKIALNKTAENAMKEHVTHVNKTFDINTSWNKVGGRVGIKKKSATKSKLEVEIYVPDKNTWIQDHEKGDKRQGLQLVPTDGFRDVFPKVKKHKAIKLLAKKLLSNKSKYRIFEAPIKKGSSTMAIHQRVKGKRKGTRFKRYKNKKGEIRRTRRALVRSAVPLFIIKKSVQEKSILKFYSNIEGVFKKRFNENFNKAFKYALSTAK